MSRVTTILVLGDPGTIRDELLLRREIDVIWAASFEDATELMRVYQLGACIVTPEFENQRDFKDFLKILRNVPCFIRRNLKREDSNTNDNDREIDSIFELLANHTGLVLARYPRANLRLPITIAFCGMEYERHTLNLSVSGVAILGCPRISMGTRVEMCLELPSGPQYLLGRAVRSFEDHGTPAVALSFTDLGEVQRQVLHQTIDEALCFEDINEEEYTVFGDILIPTVPCLPPETMPPQKHSKDTLLCESSRSWIWSKIEHQDQTPFSEGPIEVPEWFEDLSEDLTEAECTAALGYEEAPNWAHEVLRLRISLARARAEQSGSIPSSLIDEAYQIFSGLPEETYTAPLRLQQQVSSIRASLLKDIFDNSLNTFKT